MRSQMTSLSRALLYRAPPPVKTSPVWDIIRHGELVLPPHKTWTHDYTPSHTHDRFHPIF